MRMYACTVSIGVILGIYWGSGGIIETENGNHRTYRVYIGVYRDYTGYLYVYVYIYIYICIGAIFC